MKTKNIEKGLILLGAVLALAGWGDYSLSQRKEMQPRTRITKTSVESSQQESLYSIHSVKKISGLEATIESSKDSYELGSYELYTPIIINLTLKNLNDEDFKFHEVGTLSQASLFYIYDLRDENNVPISRKLFGGSFGECIQTIKSNESLEQTTNLQDYFTFNRPGIYRLSIGVIPNTRSPKNLRQAIFTNTIEIKINKK